MWLFFVYLLLKRLDRNCVREKKISAVGVCTKSVIEYFDCRNPKNKNECIKLIHKGNIFVPILKIEVLEDWKCNSGKARLPELHL